MQSSRNEIRATNHVGPEATDLALSGYALLRLSPRGWRRILSEIAGPAIRLHGLRNASTRMWREAIHARDCTAPESVAVNCAVICDE